MRQNSEVNKNTLQAWNDLYKEKRFERNHEWLNGILNFYIKPAETVLEVGCGMGTYLRHLKHRFPNKDFTGADYSNVAISRAKAAGIIDYVVWDAEKQPPPFLTKFNLVMCIETLEHTNDPNHIVRVLKSLCTDGGTLIITVPKYNSILDTNKVNWHHWSFQPADFSGVLGDKIKYIYPDNNHMIVIFKN